MCCSSCVDDGGGIYDGSGNVGDGGVNDVDSGFYFDEGGNTKDCLSIRTNIEIGLSILIQP